MANFIKRHIPNTITCCNLISGCIATGAAFHGCYMGAFALILAGAVFDFFDGMSARLLKVSSPIGKELDSLADVVTFGVAPSAMLFHLLRHASFPEGMELLRAIVPYTAFLMAAFSALRLAKFNLDTRQASSFIGVPTPANTLFWASLIADCHETLLRMPCAPVLLFLLMLLSCFLMVAEMPLFALKFKNLSWRDNKIKFIFILACIPLVIVFKYSCFAAIVAWYVLLSAVTSKRQRH